MPSLALPQNSPGAARTLPRASRESLRRPQDTAKSRQVNPKRPQLADQVDFLAPEQACRAEQVNYLAPDGACRANHGRLSERRQDGPSSFPGDPLPITDRYRTDPLADGPPS